MNWKELVGNHTQLYEVNVLVTQIHHRVNKAGKVDVSITKRDTLLLITSHHQRGKSRRKF